jgi:hypothetical protein
VATGALVATPIQFDGPARYVTSDRNGRIVAGGHRCARTEELTLGGHVDRVAAIACHPTAPLLVTVGREDGARFWDDAGELVRTLGDDARGAAAVFSPDGRRLALAHGPRVSIWYVEMQ